MKKLLLICFYILSVLVMKGKDISGAIFDSKGKPKKNLVVKIKGQFNQVETLKDGAFSLSDVNESDTLVIKISTYTEALIAVKDKNVFNIVLDKKTFDVDNGTEKTTHEYSYKKRAPRGDKMTREEIVDSGLNQVSELIKRRFAGANVYTGVDGAIGIRFRGDNSINLKSAALIIVDNTEYSSLADVDSSLDIQTIESIEVIRDGAGYGTRGASGVIIIKTKK
ncbi:TonB-dependent receptor plug domain-containing protein [Dysgonomonas sp. ZJ709]|uniref:TonB-dependent receptor plug domain-containing protein n=1 Tax=Dysgonomonas sp. ZJ709 TaxID=2709797 RepID=UPI0013EA069D|nr:TonB-dependent receptor plug domain-containing protein [Dysgonomonas sp. ZJ709]